MMKKALSLPLPELYQLKITLRDISPPIWRRVIVPADITLARLHTVIQISMGCSGYHLYAFRFRNQYFGIPTKDFPGDFEDARRVSLQDVVRRIPMNIPYEYDFGDSWVHDVKVEKVVECEKGGAYPVCVAGKRACPPEDCGGVNGYAEVLEALKKPRKKEHQEILRWVGDYDPEFFGADLVNRELSISGFGRSGKNKKS